MFRSIPEESTKVKSLLGGTLMAYQVPPPAPIQPMSAEEEREEERRAKEAAATSASASATTTTMTSSATKNASLGDIQRRTANSASLNHNNNNNNYLRQEQKEKEGTEDISQSSFSNHPSSSSSSSSACASSLDRGRAVLVNGDVGALPSDINRGNTEEEGKGNDHSQGHISKGNALESNSGAVVNDKDDNGVNAAVSRVDAAARNGDLQQQQHKRQRDDILEPLPGDSLSEQVKNDVSDVTFIDADNNAEAGPQSGFVVAVHRKILRMDVYFLSSQKSRPSLFGTPLLLPFYETTSQQDLYASVWTQIARLVSPLPPSEASSPSNHALDCDDSLGYEYPFVLKRVKKDGYTCSICPWYVSNGRWEREIFLGTLPLPVVCALRFP